ncbi:MAG: DUF4268 domain-containing protein, partial [Actinomycetota bacterium]|nr:DUF4268 domain-containing protein [Actinomycetota bacterium]
YGGWIRYTSAGPELLTALLQRPAHEAATADWPALSAVAVIPESVDVGWGYRFDMNADVPSGHYTAAFMREPRVKYELYIDSASRDRTRSVFEALLAHRTAIEAACGEQLNWRAPDDTHRHASVALESMGSIADLEHHEEIMSWFIDAGERLRAAISGGGPEQ